MIVLGRDIHGKKYARPIAGPVADLKNGLTTIVWAALKPRQKSE